jgi:hypothetical protein
MESLHRREPGVLLPAISVATLVVFYLVWGALHDIARGEADTTLECGALVLAVPAFAFLYRAALRLAPRARSVWFAGAGLTVLLFDLAAANAMLNPKYPRDAELAGLFLAAGLPLLALIAFHLLRRR